MTHKFKLIYKNPKDLIPYEKNAKKHSEQQLLDLAESMKKRKFDQPITIDGDGVIITGHGRREAAILAGIDSVPVIIRDDLTPDEVKAKRLEDNKLSSTDYDLNFLQEELSDLVGKHEVIIGFNESELSVFVDDMSKMGAVPIIDDLAVESKRREIEHDEISETISSEDEKVADVIGFKTLPSGTSSVIIDFMALCEERTGKEGAEAFAIYAKYICEQEKAKVDAMSEEELHDYLNSKVE